MKYVISASLITLMAASTAWATDATSGWDSDTQYWRSHYNSRPYYNKGTDYSAYEPAYRYGMDTYHKNDGRSFSDIDQEQLRKGWEQARGSSTLQWNEARDAVQDEYARMSMARTATPDNGGMSSNSAVASGKTTATGNKSGYVNTH